MEDSKEKRIFWCGREWMAALTGVVVLAALSVLSEKEHMRMPVEKLTKNGNACPSPEQVSHLSAAQENDSIHLFANCSGFLE